MTAFLISNYFRFIEDTFSFFVKRVIRLFPPPPILEEDFASKAIFLVADLLPFLLKKLGLQILPTQHQILLLYASLTDL